MKPKTCFNCPSLERQLNLCFCKVYVFEMSPKLARKVALCRDFELHHAMPSGQLVPVKPKMKR